MLNKLLKYDLKYMIKNMSVFYILALVFSLLTRIFSLFKQTVAIDIIGKIASGAFIAMIVNIIINTVIRSWVRFRDSLYGDESYLTHTLPVSKKNIYESQFIQTLIFLLVSFIVILITLFIAYYTKDTYDALINMISGISTSFEVSNIGLILVAILVMFFEIYNGLQSGMLGIIYGYRKNNAKVGYSILFGTIISFIGQGLMLASLFICGLFNSKVLEIFKSDIVDIGTMKFIFIFALVEYILSTIIMNFIGVKALEKGVNVE